MNMRWDKLLQSQGFGSRRQCQALITRGSVATAGGPVRDPNDAVDPHGLEFTVDGECWQYREKIVIALHKPVGIECSRKPSHHPGVHTLLPAPFFVRDVQPVGRLDHDTTGLLLLSDDGAFIHAVSSPKRQVPKLYVATTAEPVTDALVAALLAGVRLVDETAPLRATHCRVIDAHTLEIAVEQGKYHQVKRMLAAAGNHCAALCRVAVGGLRLEALGLAPGAWCELDVAQRAALFEPLA